MRKLLFNIHLYLAFIAGAFIIVFGITGSIMAFEPELDHLFHHKLYYVKPGSEKLSLQQIGKIVNNAFPRDTILGYALSSSHDLSYGIYLQDKVVFVDEYSGRILGKSTGDDWLTRFLNKVHQLHIRLIYRDKNDSGKIIMSWAGVALLIILPTGLFLWWKQKRISFRKNVSSRIRWFDIHSVVGIFSFFFMIILAFTGVMIAFENKTVPMFYKLTNSKPIPRPNITITPRNDIQPISPDSAKQIAEKTLPGANVFAVNVPGPGEYYMINSRYPEDRTPGGRSKVFIDPYTGKVLYSISSRNGPAGYRIQVINRAIHTGDIFGIPSKIIMALTSLLVVVQFISGFMLWWKRKNKVDKAI